MIAILILRRRIRIRTSRVLRFATPNADASHHRSSACSSSLSCLCSRSFPSCHHPPSLVFFSSEHPQAFVSALEGSDGYDALDAPLALEKVEERRAAVDAASSLAHEERDVASVPAQASFHEVALGIYHQQGSILSPQPPRGEFSLVASADVADERVGRGGARLGARLGARARAGDRGEVVEREDVRAGAGEGSLPLPAAGAISTMGEARDDRLERVSSVQPTPVRFLKRASALAVRVAPRERGGLGLDAAAARAEKRCRARSRASRSPERAARSISARADAIIGLTVAT